MDKTVLVVEDEEINWFYLYEILKNSVRTLHAVNGKQALEFIENASRDWNSTDGYKIA